MSKGNKGFKRYRRIQRTFDFPEGVSNIYHKIMYIEQNYPQAVETAKAEAEQFNVVYRGSGELFGTHYNPISKRLEKTKGSVRIKQARRTLNLLTGKTANEKSRNLAKQYKDKIKDYITDKDVQEAFAKAMNSNLRNQVLQEIKSVNLYYIQYTEIKEGKKVKVRRALNASNDFEGSIIQQNETIISEVLRRYKFLEDNQENNKSNEN